MTPPRRSDRIGFDSSVLIALLLLAALVEVTVVVLVDPTIVPAVVDERVDLAINSLAALIAFGVAALAWGRHREAREPGAVFRAAGFGVLGAFNALTVAVMLAHAEAAFGMSLDMPGQLPVIGTVLSRTAAAALLLLGAVVGVRGWRIGAHSGLLTVISPAVVVVGLMIVGSRAQEALPSLIGAQQLAALRLNPQQPLELAGGTLALAVMQIVVAVGYGVAAWLSLRVRSAGRGWLAAGLLVAAFSQLHAAIHPGAYSALVTTGDLLRVLFYSILLVGMVIEWRADLRSLEVAHSDLQRLRQAELAQATYEERGRLAREIHDGLAQDLWYAKLKQARLADAAELSDDARSLIGEVAAAIDSALLEARSAVMALRPAAAGSFSEVLARSVDEFADRFGIRAEHQVAAALELAPRAQAEVLRIVQEALTNVRQHADATVVRVHAAQDSGGVTVRIADNGRGFDPVGADPARYGLRSMRERAESVGGRLNVDSRPLDGTRVEIVIPAAPR